MCHCEDCEPKAKQDEAILKVARALARSNLKTGLLRASAWPRSRNDTNLDSYDSIIILFSNKNSLTSVAMISKPRSV